MKGEYAASKTGRIRGFFRRYLDTEEYSKDFVSSGGDLQALRERFDRDRRIVRKTFVPLSVAAAIASYFTPVSMGWSKKLGHVSKGYALSEAGIMASESKAEGLKKYCIGAGTAGAGALAWEASQEAGLVGGSFDPEDIAFDMAGAAIAIGIENYFDRKLAALYEDS